MSFDNGGFINEENEPQKINQNDQIGDTAAMENEFYYDGNVHVKSGTNRIVRKRKSKKKQLIQSDNAEYLTEFFSHCFGFLRSK